MPEISIRIKADSLLKALNKFPIQLQNAVQEGLKSSIQDTVENIKETYIGTPYGFKDRTGALRRSINGSVLETESEDEYARGYVGAGNDEIGSDGKPTRDYVEAIEFGEFKKAGHTAFLRPGVYSERKNITKSIRKQVNDLLGSL